MSQIPAAGTAIRVPTTFLQQQFTLPQGAPGVGKGIAEAGLAIANAIEKIRATQNKRRLAEIEVENINLLSGLHEQSIKASLDQDMEQANNIFRDGAETRLNVLKGLQDRDLRNAAVSQFAVMAARTGASLRSSLVRAEATRLETSDDAFIELTMRAVQAGTIEPDDATAMVEARLLKSVGIYLTPEQAELRTTRIRGEFEIAASDSAKAGLLNLAVTLTSAYAKAENQEQRDGLRVAFGAAVAQDMNDGKITQDEGARRMVAFDATAKGKVLEEIASIRQMLQDAVALGELDLIDRLATRANQLPDMPQRNTLFSELRRGMIAAQRARDGSGRLLEIFGSGRPMPADAPAGRGDRNGAYAEMRRVNVPITVALDFFAQDGILPTDLTRDVRALFDPGGSTFSIVEGIKALQAVHERDRDAARRLVAEGPFMKVALAAGVQGDAKMREDAIRLLSAGTAGRRLPEINRVIAPQTKEERAGRIDVVEMLGDADGIKGAALVSEDQRDLYAGLLRLEYLRGRIDFGETEDKVADVAANASKRAAASFLRIRSGVQVVRHGSVKAVYYDPRLVGDNVQQFEAALFKFVAAGEGIGAMLFGLPNLPQPGMMVRFPEDKVLVPIFDDQGVSKVMVFDTTVFDFERATTYLRRGDAGFEDLAGFIVESNRGASFDPLGHLRRQAGDSGFPADSMVLEYLQTGRDMLIGMELPASDLQKRAEIIAERLARERGWDGLWEPEGE